MLHEDLGALIARHIDRYATEYADQWAGTAGENWQELKDQARVAAEAHAVETVRLALLPGRLHPTMLHLSVDGRVAAASAMYDLNTDAEIEEIWDNTNGFPSHRTTEDELVILSIDPEMKVRAMVASHPRLPVGALDALAHDRSHLVAAAALTNPRMPVETLKEFAWRLDRPQLREAVANNPSTPQHVLLTLATERDMRVARGARANLVIQGADVTDLWGTTSKA